jgi:hypothetical protein
VNEGRTRRLLQRDDAVADRAGCDMPLSGDALETQMPSSSFEEAQR